MKSIKITKSELRQLIRESVKEELVREAILKEGVADVAGNILGAIKDFLSKNPELAAKIVSGGIGVLTTQIKKLLSKGGGEGSSEGGSISEARRLRRYDYVNEGLLPDLSSLTGSTLTNAASGLGSFFGGGSESLLSKIPKTLLGPLGSLLMDKKDEIMELAAEVAEKAKEKLSESIKKDVRLVLRRYR